MNCSWQGELRSSSQLAPKFLDLAVVCRSAARSAFRGTDLADSGDRFLVEALFDKRHGKEGARNMLVSGMRRLSVQNSFCSMTVLVCKIDVGFQPDNNVADIYHRPYSDFLNLSLLHLHKVKRFFLIDSVVTRDCLRVISHNMHGWIRIVSTRIHCGDMCDHLVQPLYIKDQVLHTTKNQESAVWARLLDMYGLTTDTQALELLKIAVCNKKSGLLHKWEMENLYR